LRRQSCKKAHVVYQNLSNSAQLLHRSTMLPWQDKSASPL
jgi:hypothetical protein